MATRTKSEAGRPEKAPRAIRPRAAHAKSLRRQAQAGTSATSEGAEIAHQEIALLAYSYWQARGCENGSPEEDWFRAERELRAARNRTS